MGATLAVGGAAYFIGGAKAATIAIMIGVAIIIWVHFTRGNDKENKLAPAPIPKTVQNNQNAMTGVSGITLEQHFHAAPPTEPRQAVPSPLSVQKARLNLQLRRVYPKRIWVGHEITGHNIGALVAEIGNEIGEKVGAAEGIRAHVTYKSNDENLQVVCPARWEGEGHTVWLKVGESRNVVLAVNRGYWLSREYDGVVLELCSEIQLRILDTDGNVLSDPIIFDCSLKDNGQNPVCKKRAARSPA